MLWKHLVKMQGKSWPRAGFKPEPLTGESMFTVEGPLSYIIAFSDAMRGIVENKKRIETTLKYDDEEDILSLDFEGTKITHSEEINLRIVLDYDKDETVVGFEILDFKKQVNVSQEVLEKLK